MRVVHYTKSGRGGTSPARKRMPWWARVGWAAGKRVRLQAGKRANRWLAGDNKVSNQRRKDKDLAGRCQPRERLAFGGKIINGL